MLHEQDTVGPLHSTFCKTYYFSPIPRLFFVIPKGGGRWLLLHAASVGPDINEHKFRETCTPSYS